MVEISVIIPVYNVEKYLPETLECLSGQSFEDAEFILVDDGSKDGSLAICREFAARDPRFVVISQVNGGPARARNTGMDAAVGRYICFMDSDDLLADEALSRMHDMVRGYDVLIHSTDFIGDYDTVPAWISDASKVKDEVCENFCVRDIFTRRGCGPVLWLHMVRAELIQKEHLRIDEKLFIGEDFSFAATYLLRAERVRFVSDKFYRYRLFRQGSIMTTFQECPREKLDQALAMSRTMFLSIRDRIRPTDETAMIQALLIFNFRDIYRLPEEDQKRYSKVLVMYLNSLHAPDHLAEFRGKVLMMYGYIKGVDDGSLRVGTHWDIEVIQEYWDMFAE